MIQELERLRERRELWEQPNLIPACSLHQRPVRPQRRRCPANAPHPFFRKSKIDRAAAGAYSRRQVAQRSDEELKSSAVLKREALTYGIRISLVYFVYVLLTPAILTRVLDRMTELRPAASAIPGPRRRAKCDKKDAAGGVGNTFCASSNQRRCCRKPILKIEGNAARRPRFRQPGAMAVPSNRASPGRAGGEQRSKDQVRFGSAGPGSIIALRPTGPKKVTMDLRDVLSVTPDEIFLFLNKIPVGIGAS